MSSIEGFEVYEEYWPFPNKEAYMAAMTDDWAKAVDTAATAMGLDGMANANFVDRTRHESMEAALRAALPYLVGAVISKVYEQTYLYKLVESPIWPSQMRDAVEALTGKEWPEDD